MSTVDAAGAAAWPFDARQAEAEMLYARYSYGVDSRCASTLDACFAADVRFGTDEEEPTIGRAATVERLVARSVPGTLHMAVNVLVDWAAPADAVRGRADFVMLRAGRVIASGVYADRLRWREGRLVFAERLIRYGWRAGKERG